MILNRKILGLTLAGALFVSTLSITPDLKLAKAAPNIDTHAIVRQNSSSDTEYIIKINGETCPGAKGYLKGKSTVMIPLRLVSEALGYEVKWNGQSKTVELSRGPHWITTKIGEDYYTFGKMAPMKLGTAPEVFQEVTFVPLDFVTEILKVHINRDKAGIIDISQEKPLQEQTALQVQGSISEIVKTDQGVMLLVNGGREDSESIVLKVYEDTKIVNPLTGEAVLVDDLKEGDNIRGFYKPMLTKSLPPQANAEKIEVLKDIGFTRGNITEIGINEDNAHIFVGDFPDGIKLIIGDETKIVTEDNRELTLEDLQEGTQVDVYYGPIMTMSLPPISLARRVVVK